MAGRGGLRAGESGAEGPEVAGPEVAGPEVAAGGDARLAGLACGIRFSVCEGGAEILVYHFPSLAAARETYLFVRDFFPGANFVFEPALH